MIRPEIEIIRDGGDGQLADRMDDALEQLWSGDSVPLDALMSECDGDAVGVGRRVRDAIAGGPPGHDGLADLKRVGEYEIVREIGRGAMGVVFEARSRNPERTVAVKVVRGGPALDDYYLRLYEREVQTLARLQHPNIAAFHAAGVTEDGLRYFAMEYVQGIRLDAWDGDRRARLRVFIELCRGVAAAHQRGVVHRDLKPSNVIIDDDGRPRVLDFGLAHLLAPDVAPDDDSDRLTETLAAPGRVLGTLPYVSPEQARGESEQVDIRTDVYSLGVILYELMTGQRPYEFNGSALHDAVRVICEQTPERPGTLSRTLRGDLETIMLKALEKDPERRYDSAVAFGDDVERFLALQPILARAPSRWYQTRKFVRRHWPIVSVFAGLVLVLVLGTGGTVWGLVQAQRRATEATEATTRANAAAAHAQDVTRFLQRVIAMPQLREGRPLFSPPVRRPVQRSGTPVTVRELLGQAAADLENEFATEPIARAEILSTLGRTYLAIGDAGAAVRLLAAASDICVVQYGADDPRTIETRLDLVDAYREAARVDDSIDGAADLLARSEAVNGRTDTLTIRARLIAARGYAVQRRLGLAESLLLDAVDDAVEGHGASSTVAMEALRHLVALREAQNDDEAALALLEDLVALREERDPEWARTETLRDATRYGMLLTRQWRHEDAQQVLERAVAGWKTRHGPDHVEALAASTALAASLNNLERLDEAESLIRVMLPRQVRTLGARHPQALRSLRLLGRVLIADRARWADAPLPPRGQRISDDRQSTLALLMTVGGVNEQAGDLRTAVDMAAEVEAVLTRDHGIGDPRAIAATCRHAEVLIAHQRDEEAREVLVRAWPGAFEAYGRRSAAMGDLAALLVPLLERLGDAETADAYLDELDGRR